MATRDADLAEIRHRMADFDRLPDSLRAAVREADRTWDCGSLLLLILDGAPTSALVDYVRLAVAS